MWKISQLVPVIAIAAVAGPPGGALPAAPAVAPDDRNGAAEDTRTVEGVPMMLPDGRLAIFGPEGDRVVLLRVMPVGPSREPLLDLRSGDVVEAFQGVEVPALPRFRAVLAATPTGESLRFVMRRGDAIHPVVMPKPGSSFLVPPSALPSAGQGKGWTEAGKTPVAVTEPDPEGVRRLLEEAIPDSGPGMTVAVWSKGSIVAREARGKASLELDVPLRPDTILPVASVSKQFAGFALALLAERGRLSLNDAVRRHLPELSHLDPSLNIRHLLNHTSGLKDYTGLLSLTGWSFGDRLSRDDLLALVSRQRELQFVPGEQHRYSNTNYALLPVIVERITGTPFQDWMEREVFAPIGMKKTLFPASSGMVVPGSGSLYRPVEAGYEQAHGEYGLAGPGGLLSTAPDLLLWSGELMTGAVGGVGVQRAMRTPARLKDGTEVPYGLGIGMGDFRGVPRLSHSGSGPGSASVLHVYPDDDLAVAVLANHGEAEVFDLAEKIAALYLGARLGAEPDAPRRAGMPGAFMITDEHFRGEGTEGEPVSPERLASFAGRYRLEDEREVVLEADGDVLSMKLRDDLPGVPLKHLGKDRFLFPPAGWQLSVDPGSRPAEQITVHLLEGAVFRGEPRDVRGFRTQVAPLTAARRAGLTGSYSSPELGVVYRIVERDGRLVLEHPRLGDSVLTHHTGDIFGVTDRPIRRLRFERAEPDDADDAGSAVTALLVEARAWGTEVRFERQ